MTQIVFAGDEPRDYLDPQIGHVEPGDVREVDDDTVAALDVDGEGSRWTNPQPLPPVAKKTAAPKPTPDPAPDASADAAAN